MSINHIYKESFVLPDFVGIQINSFRFFLSHYISLEFQKFPILKSPNQEIEFHLLNNRYQFVEPICNDKDAVYNLTTYASELYISAQLLNNKYQKISTQTLSIGYIPLMNSQGTFVVNGVPRVVVNQIVRNPGIYYTNKDNNTFIATIISNSGRRFKFLLDRKGYMWVQINKKYKVSVALLLLSMGTAIHDIPNFLKDRTKDFDQLPTLLDDAITELCNQLSQKPRKVKFSKLTSQILPNDFIDICELGEIGRCSLNQRLHLNVPQEEKYLIPQDIIIASEYLIKLSDGVGILDDIDHLKNKYVHSAADLLHEHLCKSMNILLKTVHRGMKRAMSRRTIFPHKIVNSVLLNSLFIRLLGFHELSQFLDQTNPLADMVHKRKLSSLGPGGLTRRTANFKVRDIHPSQYGRICPVETSEGSNAGLIVSFSTFAKINSSRKLVSPLYHRQETEKSKDYIYISADEEEGLKTANDSLLTIDDKGEERNVVSSQYRHEFLNLPIKKINYRKILPIQNFSIGVSLIPFLEHDDANRALMGSNMQRQAVPLTKMEKPIIGTGLEGQVALDSGYSICSLINSHINYVDAHEVMQTTLDGQIFTKKFSNLYRSNNNTCINQKPRVNSGDYIRYGQLLADGFATFDGELALGKNILVAYMPWEGYNFEDAVLISERLINEDIYTSITINRYEIELGSLNSKEIKITRDIPNFDLKLLRNLDENGIVIVGSWVDVGDILVGKLLLQEEQSSIHTPEGKLLQAIFGIQNVNTKENCLKVPPGGKGRVIDVRIVTINEIQYAYIYILQKRKIQIGDKVAGRHGNKGIVSKILLQQDMPYLQNGIPVDMVLSPLGVPSRMNVGQIFECLLGLAGNFLTKHYRITPFDERYEKDASRKLVFSELFRSRQKTGWTWLFEPNTPGKNKVFDGRTGEPFEQNITIGNAYILKLIHQVDDKIHARSSGPYALVTQQPLRGRSRRGGQRVGEMEVWALEGFGAAYILQEMLSLKSDHIEARSKILSAVVTGDSIFAAQDPPECFRLLTYELRCLGIQITHNILSRRDLTEKNTQI